MSRFKVSGFESDITEGRMKAGEFTAVKEMIVLKYKNVQIP